MTLEEISKVWNKVKPKKNEPIINNETHVFAGLDIWALYPEVINRVEKLIKRDVLWNDMVKNDSFIYINPTKLELPEIELDYKRTRSNLEWLAGQPLMLSPPLTITTWGHIND